MLGLPTNLAAMRVARQSDPGFYPPDFRKTHNFLGAVYMSLIQTVRFIADHPLNKNNSAKAILGFLKWQLGSRLVPGPTIMNWVNGSRVIIRRGETGLTGNLYCGLHEFWEMAYVLHAVSPEDLFVDVGANVGSYTVLACAAKGAKGICFEPVPATYKRLLDNISLNSLIGRVEALNVGLAERSGELVFTSEENCTNHVVPSELGGGGLKTVRVPVTTLDEALEGRSPSVMKIDVEGFELPVIRGSHATLRNPTLHSVIMELNGSGARYGFSEREIVDIMCHYGFLPYVYEPFSRELKPLDGKNSQSGNTLFIRNLQAVREIISKAPPATIRDIQL